MEIPREFPKALKMFAKEVGVPEAIIADFHNCHKLNEVKQFFTRLVRP